jgi:hypothetical protein
VVFVGLPIELLRLRDELLRFVDEPLRAWVDEYLVFLDGFIRCLDSRHRELLLCDSDEPGVVRARVNSYYAYLIHRGYVTAYELLKNGHIRGYGAVYKWLRVFRNASCNG